MAAGGCKFGVGEPQESYHCLLPLGGISGVHEEDERGEKVSLFRYQGEGGKKRKRDLGAIN